MDNRDAELIRQMCKHFNIHLTESTIAGDVLDSETDVPYFDLNGLVEINAPSPDTDGKWAILKITVRPGVRTLPNGDPGYPDEIEMEEVSFHDTCLQALVEGVKLVVEMTAGDIAFDISMYEEWKEEQGNNEQSV